MKELNYACVCEPRKILLFYELAQYDPENYEKLSPYLRD